MPRFNKTAILALLTATSSVFLLFQLYYYRQHVSQNGPHIFGRTVHLSGKDTQWKVVKKFMGLVHKYNLPVFLVDTASLTLLSQESMPLKDSLLKQPHCSFLCTNRDFLTFALLGNLWKYDAGLVSAAEEKGFELLEVRGKDPRLVSMDDLSGNEIPFHFLFRLNGYVVHVVVLYERSGNYLWHGLLRLKPNMDQRFAPFRKLDYGQNAGAYDRPELVLTTLDGLDVRIPRNITEFLTEYSQARFLECRYREARSFFQVSGLSSLCGALLLTMLGCWTGRHAPSLRFLVTLLLTMLGCWAGRHAPSLRFLVTLLLTMLGCWAQR